MRYVVAMGFLGLQVRILQCGKHHMIKYGGWGYGHIIEHIVPRLRDRGVSEDEINAIYVGNPVAVLTLV